MILSNNAVSETSHVQSAKPDAIAIVGATASGKTATSLELASNLAREGIGSEIISADSRQLYRFLTIGTAKPSREELMRVPHHFIDCRNPDETCSAGEFGTEAAQILSAIRSRGNVPIIVGGSGLYVKALTDGMFDETAELATDAENSEYARLQEEARSRLQSRFETEGIDILYAELQTIDSVSAAKYTDRNPRRIIRALEHYILTGIPLSQAHQTSHVGRDFTTVFFGIASERETLYKRINTRTEDMFAQGIIEETASVLAMGYASTCNSLKTVGYKECLSLLQGEISRERAKELTAQNTRRYAKRQLTWFRRDERIIWRTLPPDELAREIAREYIADLE
jgi:tRNA dimethylallyltransferase